MMYFDIVVVNIQNNVEYQYLWVWDNLIARISVIQNGTPSTSQWRNMTTFVSKILFTMNVKRTWSNLCQYSNLKSSWLRIASQIKGSYGGHLAQSPRVNKWCHFCSYNVVESETHSILECPLYNSIRDDLNLPHAFRTWMSLTLDIKKM